MGSSTASHKDPINVAIAGPTGSLGPCMLTAFLASTSPSFHLTLLTRDATKTQTLLDDLSTQTLSSVGPSKVTIKLVSDYTDQTLLQAALSDNDALVVLLNRDLGDQSIALTNAAIAAGVSHIIPSSFGVDISDPYLRACPPILEKVRMLDHLVSAIASQPTPPPDGKPVQAKKTTFTAVDTGVFIEHMLPMGFIVNPKSAHDDSAKSMLIDSGTAQFAMSALSDIGTATKNAVVLGVAGDDRVTNKFMKVQTMSTSQNALLGYAREFFPERKWAVMEFDTKMAEEKSREQYEKGERSADALRGYLIRGTFGLGLGEFKEDDNEVLGVKNVGEEGAKKILRGYL